MITPMKKIKPKHYRGIEYIQITDLPATQIKPFLEWIPSSEIIKIITENKLLTQCVQYRNYTEWFEKNYPAELVKTSY